MVDKLPALTGAPEWWDVVITWYNKSKTICPWRLEKSFLRISVILWVLASYGPANVEMDENTNIEARPKNLPLAKTNPDKKEQIQRLRPHPSCWKTPLSD